MSFPLGYLAIDPWLPPPSLALLALLALLLWRRRGRAVAVALLLGLLLLSLPLVGAALLRSLDPPAADAPAAGTTAIAAAPAPQAIVILSGDVERAGAPDHADIGPLTLERERAGAALARRTGLPVLVTGGFVTELPPVGQMMARSMPADFNVPVRWVEDESLTTWDNARLSVPMLKAAGITRIYLVTHDWHMRRALVAFRHWGMDAVPAPVRVDPPPQWSGWSLVPRTSAWERSSFAIHEWVGLLYYELRG